MTPLAFLALALVISVVGTLVLWARHRSTDAPDSTIDEFRSKMRALSDEERNPAGNAPRQRRGDTTRQGG